MVKQGPLHPQGRSRGPTATPPVGAHLLVPHVVRGCNWTSDASAPAPLLLPALRPLPSTCVVWHRRLPTSSCMLPTLLRLEVGRELKVRVCSYGFQFALGLLHLTPSFSIPTSSHPDLQPFQVQIRHRATSS